MIPIRIYLLPNRYRLMRIVLSGFFLIIGFSSCFTIKPVEFKKAENIGTSMNDSAFEMTFDLNMHNPNNWSLRLTEVKTEVIINNQPLGKANLSQPIRLMKNSDFKIPMLATSSTVDFSKFASMGLSLLLGNKTATATIKGNITLKKFIFRKKYPFEYKERIDAKFLESLF